VPRCTDPLRASATDDKSLRSVLRRSAANGLQSRFQPRLKGHLYYIIVSFLRGSFVACSWWFVSDVYIWTDPYVRREVFSALFVLSHTNGARRTMSTGTGTTRRARNQTPSVCHSAAANSLRP